MAIWKCPVPNCTFSVGAPDKEPSFSVPAWSKAKPGPPTCPDHYVPTTWMGDTTNGKEEQQDSVFGDTTYVQNPLYGVHVGSNNLGDIYCDFHQRKHVTGGLWPGKVPVDKPRFKNAIFHIGK